jgi:hypothetical protein
MVVQKTHEGGRWSSCRVLAVHVVDRLNRSNGVNQYEPMDFFGLVYLMHPDLIVIINVEYIRVMKLHICFKIYF